MKNYKLTLMLIALLTALSLGLTGCGSAAVPAQTPTPAPTAAPTADPLADWDVTGPWALSTAKNDMAALYTVFGTSLRDYGAGMEIRSDGQMQYFVGTAGAAGTYTRDGSLFTAQLVGYNENDAQTLTLQLVQDGDGVYLTCTVYDTLLWWTQNLAVVVRQRRGSGGLRCPAGNLPCRTAG